MHIAVVANGVLPPAPPSSLNDVLRDADYVIAADGGLIHCVALDCWPDAVVGDLDSAPEELVERAKSQGAAVIAHPVDKDATDLELALFEASDRGATRISVVAPFGGRLDHEQGSIALLAAQRWAHVRIEALDGRRHMWVVRSACELDLPVGATVSLLPWGGAVSGVTTTGLQWPLVDDDLALGSTRAVSNVAIESIQTVVVATGTLLVIFDRG